MVIVAIKIVQMDDIKVGFHMALMYNLSKVASTLWTLYSVIGHALGCLKTSDESWTTICLANSSQFHVGLPFEVVFVWIRNFWLAFLVGCWSFDMIICGPPCILVIALSSVATSRLGTNWKKVETLTYNNIVITIYSFKVAYNISLRLQRKFHV